MRTTRTSRTYFSFWLTRSYLGESLFTLQIHLYNNKVITTVGPLPECSRETLHRLQVYYAFYGITIYRQHTTIQILLTHKINKLFQSVRHIMRNVHAERMDSASECMASLRLLMQRPVSMQKELELGLLQQYLDEESLYIKQIPRDHANVFRAFSDALLYTQSQHEKLLLDYIRILEENVESHELARLLMMATTMNTSTYAKTLGHTRKGRMEVDTILIALFFCLDLTVYHISESGLTKEEFRFGKEGGPTRQKISLYLGADGGLDTVYEKSSIKAAGICQSILLELFDRVINAAPGKGKSKAHVPVYQNFEFQHWRQEQTGSTSQLKIAFGTALPYEDGIAKERETPSRKNVSDTSVGTPSLRRQIRGYLSSDSVSPIQAKVVGPAPETQRVMKKSQFVPSASTSGTGSAKDQQLPDSFATYMEAYRQPYGVSHMYYPQPTTQYYGGSMGPMSAVPVPPGMAPSSLYQSMPPASSPYVPVYIPVLMQQPMPISTPTPSYTYPPAPGAEVLTGRIKFFDTAQNYGFFTLDCDGTDLFVHYDDFLKAGVTKDYIHIAKAVSTRFAFRKVSYYGKYNLSSKAVDIQIIQEQAATQ